MSDALSNAFPQCDPGVKPLGSRVLVQIRTPEERSKGGIILSTSDKETQLWNTSVAKVVAIGSLAFRNRNTQDLWPEGSWCSPGDYVRVPKYGGDRFTTENESGQIAHWALYNDLDMIALVTSDPLAARAFF